MTDTGRGVDLFVDFFFPFCDVVRKDLIKIYKFNETGYKSSINL